MNAKTMMTTAALALLATAAQAITSEEIAAALDVDPSIGTFSCSGSADWYVDAENATNGASCMRSGSVVPTQRYEWKYSILDLSLTVKEPVVFAFWTKTSAYNCNNYEALLLSVDGSVASYSGETGWHRESCVLTPGSHQIKFTFQRYRDYYTLYSSGSDCAWIDNIELTPILESTPTVSVNSIKCTQRTPWNGKVDIDYTITCDKEDADVWVFPVGYNKDTDIYMAPRALEGDGVGSAVKPGTHRMTWTVTEDYPDFNSTAFTVKMTALIGAAPYMVIDLSGGVDALSYPVEYLSSVPSGGWGDEYKTTKMVLRLIPAGSFVMGSPSDEPGRGSYEDQHGVVLTKPFYIGVFECTQKQYQLIMGSNPAGYKGDARPVENVSYSDLRGSVNGAGWPTHNQVDAGSFMGRLRSKVNMFFDLPTEAQWEYACRAGSGYALPHGNYSDAEMKTIARYWGNSGYDSRAPSDGKGGYSYTTTVGSYLENAWGLYDMLGNVAELCRDYWNQGLGTWGSVDPKGSGSSYDRYGNGYKMHPYRGGHWYDTTGCRAAYRSVYFYWLTDKSSTVGFRVYCSPVAQ